jgi:hypothetical protein
MDLSRAATHAGPQETYRARMARFAAEGDRLRARGRTLAWARLLVFGVLIAAGLWLERGGGAPALLATAAAAAAFIALLVVHRRLRAAESWADAHVALNEQGLHRLARDWDRLPAPEPPPERHAYARDLDVFGRASLRQILGPAGTATGRTMLREWLLDAATPTVIVERQAAVRDLAGRNDLRDAVAVHAGLTRRVGGRAIEEFLAWAEGDAWLKPRPLLLWTARLLTLVTWALIGLHAAGVTGALPWLTMVAVNYMLTASVRKRLHAVYDRAFARDTIFQNYPPLFEALCHATLEAPLLTRLQGALGAKGNGLPAHMELHRLVRFMDFSEVRRSSLTYLPVQLLTLWDFHLVAALENWQARAGSRARGWIDAAGQIEALAALAALAHDQPAWAWPEIAPPSEPPQLEARALGHPLLADDARVGNDVRVGPPGSFLLVTGSNMSGKSTLLRSIGLNAVLAQAGAPVCADALRMPPLVVRTSIRIEDSIASGVSLFMAELLQMKSIVESARTLEKDPDRALLFLLDEILHGTNTAERRIAARRIITHLVEHGAIGAVTTHDLTLAEDPALGSAGVPVYFTETVNPEDAEAPMSFDYRLREGLATSTNALRLMELVGLAVERD